jgi:anti-sigma B factor antagonist
MRSGENPSDEVSGASARGSFANGRLGDFQVERSDDGRAIVVISGEHDLYTAPNLRDQLEALREQGEGVVIDLSHATFIDSSVLGVLVEACRRAREEGVGCELALRGGSEAVSRVLDVTGLRRALPVHPSRAAALGAVGDEGPR